MLMSKHWQKLKIIFFTLILYLETKEDYPLFAISTRTLLCILFISSFSLKRKIVGVESPFLTPSWKFARKLLDM